MDDPYRETITRREAMLRLSSAAVAAGALTAGALVFHDRRAVAAEAAALPDWRLKDLSGIPPAVAANGPDAAANVRAVVAALGGMQRFVKRGETVLIKPNMGWDRLPEQGANTDPNVVAELVRLCLAAGAKKVTVTDNTCNDPRRCFARSGIAEAAAKAGAEVIPTAQIAWVQAALGGLASGLEVPDALLKADRVINVPVVKHHSLSRATLGMKNWMGMMGKGRNRLHQDINRAEAEMGAMFRPTLTVMDATRTLMANGPQGGSLSDVKTVNALAAGVDPVLCDAWGAARMGLDLAAMPYITEAQRRGLGSADLKKVKAA